MRQLLLRKLLLLAGLLLAGAPAWASHLLGGEMTYRYLDANGPAGTPFRYEITIISYYNPNGNVQLNAANATAVTLSLFNRTTGARISSLLVPRQEPVGAVVQPPRPPSCLNAPPSVPFRIFRYIATVNLPATLDGYYAVCEQTARNAGIDNIQSPGTTPMTLYVSIAPPLIPNRSPIFSDTAVAIICANDTTTLLNNAVDPDGDRLIYSFGTPSGAVVNPNSFPPFPAPVNYNSGFSQTNPFGTGPGNFAIINANTGTTRYGTTRPRDQQFVVAVDVSEYRTINGREVLLGTTRRDIQLVVADCGATTVAPVLAAPNLQPRSVTVAAGASVSFPITATQATGNPLQMTVNSILLDGPGGPIDATFAGQPGTVAPGNPTGTVTISGTGGRVSGTFTLNASCALARTAPYDISVTVRDPSCGGKTTVDVFRVTVTLPSGPTALSGDAAVCNLGTVSTYTASGGTAPGLSWRVVGGTIVGPSTGSSVQVRWTTAGTGLVVARGVSAQGCRTDSVSQSVAVAPGGTLTVAAGPAGLSLCQGASTTLTVSGGTGPYTLTGGGTPTQTGAGPFTVSPTQTTTYTITGTAVQGCAPNQQVTVTVSPVPAAAVGAPVRAGCAGSTLQLGAAPVPGNTYQWSPATGLSSATVANPTLTLTNTTGAPLTQTYTLTETSATGGCTASNSVVVTINPLPVAVAGPTNQAFCSGASVQLGTVAVPGLTYQWSPATGLNDPTVSNPTVTLTNTGSAPFNQTYTLTVTSAAGCSTSANVTITVNPLPAAVPGPAVALCSGASVQLGAAPVPGLTYQWSPTTGLSSPTVANPTLTLTNTTGAPVVQTYTLTVRDPNTQCSSTGTVAVTVNPLPAVAPPATVAFCSGSSTQLGAAPVPGFTYQWSPTTGLSSPTVANPTLTLPNTTGAPVTQTYTLTVTNAATGCAATSTTAVTVNPLPVVSPGAALTVCPGTPGQLGAAPVAGFTYQWSPVTGLSNPAIANPTVTLANNTSAPITQTYTLTVTNSATGCVSTGSVAVTVSPAVVVSAGAARALCAGSTTTLGTAALPGYTYAWTPTAGLSSATAAQPVYTAANATNAPISIRFRVTATSPQGCTARDSVLVTVNPLPPSRTITGPGFVCDPNQSLTATYTLSGAPTTSTYQWSAVGGTITGGQGTATVAVTFASGNATRTLSVVETSQFGCTATSATTLNILLDQPTVNLSLASVDPNSNGRVLLTYQVPNGQNTPNQVQVLRRPAGSTGAFQVVGTTPATATTFADATAQASQSAYEYGLQLTNGCGTVLTAPTTQTTILLQATATAPATVSDQGGTRLTWTPYVGFNVGGYAVYQQNDNGGYNLLTRLPATARDFTVANVGQGFQQCFRVVAESAAGAPAALASNSNTACVSFENKLVFYNIITPNGDGLNDKLEIKNVQLYPGNSMQIFNRWGREVFATTNYNNANAWGSDPGVAPGIYYFLFKQADGTATKGWVEVVR